jgi:hypothetical protein
MGRMEWFRDMRALFLELSQGKREVVGKDELVEALNLKGPELDLQDPEVFKSANKVVFYSFDQVIRRLDHAKELALTWDQVIDYLIQLGLAQKTGRPPRRFESAGLYEESPRGYLTSSTDRTPRKSLAKKGFAVERPLKSAVLPLQEYFNKKPVLAPSVHNSSDLSSSGLSSLPRLANFNTLIYLSLSGNSLTHTRFDWPPSLILLSLSHNHLQDLDFKSSLGKLQLLNISFNSVRQLPSMLTCKGLVELYADHNELRQISCLSRLPNLMVVDLSWNSLDSIEELASLSVLQHLTVMKLNQNNLGQDYRAVIKTILPRLCEVDPADIAKLSRFQSVKQIAFNEIKGDVTPYTPENKSRTSKPVLRKHNSEAKLKEIKIDNSKVRGSPNLRYSPKISRPSSVLSEIAVSRSATRAVTTEAQTPPTSSSAILAPEDRSIGRPCTEHLESAMQFVEELDRRLLSSQGKLETFSTLNKSVSHVTHQTIHQAQQKAFGNPVAALMIGPPAARTASSRVRKPPVRPVQSKVQVSLNRETRVMRRTYDSCR